MKPVFSSVLYGLAPVVHGCLFRPGSPVGSVCLVVGEVVVFPVDDQCGSAVACGPAGSVSEKFKGGRQRRFCAR